MLIEGAVVFDGEEVERDLSVLIEGEKIARMAPSEAFADYRGERLDATGMTLLPGLIDCHVHLCFGAEGDPKGVMAKLSDAQITLKALENARSNLAGGITSVRDCGGKDYLEFAVRDLCRSGKILGPTIMAAGRMICMTGGHGNYIGRVADGEAEVIKAVREQIHAGCDLCKIMATGGVMTPGVNPEDAHYTESELRAGISEAHRFSRHTASHAQGTAGILNAVRAGIDSIEHGIFMDQQCIDEMLANDVYLVPTVAALKNILKHKDLGIPDFIVEKTERVSVRHKDSIQRFHQAGGKIAMGTDAGTPYNRHGANAQEIEYMVEMGLSNVEALRTATANAADLMGMDNRGRLREGLRADMLLVQGDAIEDIRAVSEVSAHRWLWKDGRVVRSSDAEGISRLHLQ